MTPNPEDSATVPVRERFSGWGRMHFAESPAVRPASAEDLPALLAARPGRPLLAFGAGRSYGDACLNRNGLVVRTTSLDAALSFDTESGVLEAEAGLTYDDLVSFTLPRGWFPPVTPGTRRPTLGGSLATDVHGKNHHRDGSLSRHVLWLDLLTASGEVLRCSPTENGDLFRATAGGMGLTGIILRLGLQLARVPSAYIAEETLRAGALEELMGALEEGDREWRYTVAWLDGTARGTALGRGVVFLGRHAEVEELPIPLRGRPFSLPRWRAGTTPFVPPVSLVNRASIGAFNAAYLARVGRGGHRRSLVPLDRWFYPLDRLRHWNRLYGPRGFTQLQFVVPPDAGERAVRESLETCRRSGFTPALAVLKRLGEPGGLLSFPVPGWTLALDLPARVGLETLLDRLHRMVLEQGGRVYLAKDAHLAPEVFRGMYPRFPEWLEIKRRVDPEDVFSSDLARRLRLSEP